MSGKLIKKIIDIGANLTDPMFRGIYHSSQKHPDDFLPMINRAKEIGVEKFIITGGSLSDSMKALQIAELDNSFYSTVGCHPTRCSEFTNFKGGPDCYLDELEKLIRANTSKVVAIGELGLDYDRTEFCDIETQKTYFEKQLSLSQRAQLPLFLHNRNSIDDFVEILQKNADKFKARSGVVHSFDGTAQDLNRILELGLSIGINGCSLKKEQNLDVARLIPSDRLLIETDCPWCEVKQSHAGFRHVRTTFQKSKDASDPRKPVKNRNEPAQIIQVLEILASVRQEDIDILAEQIYDNTIKLFFNK